MAFDPSVIAGIGDSNAGAGNAQIKALGIKDMLDRTQLSRLNLDREKREAGESTQVNEILKGSDYSTPQGLAETAEKVKKVSPRAAMDLLKTGQSYQSGEVQNQIDQLTLADKRQELIVTSIDPIVSQARQMKNSGASDLDVKAFITQQMPQALQNLRGMKLGDGKPALPDDVLKMVTENPGGYNLATLEGWESRSKAGQAAIKQRLEQFRADTQAKKEGNEEARIAETERHNRAGEATAAEKARLLKAAKSFGGPEGELLGALAERGVSLPAGLRSQQQMKATLGALVARNPGMSADQIAEKIETGQIAFGTEKKETQIAAGVAGKIRYAEEEINRLVPLVQQASTAVPRGSFVPWTQLKQYSGAKLSDPNLKKLKAYMTTLSNSYDLLAARGGTDVEKRKHNRELFDTADSPEALQVALDAVLTEARVSGEAAQASTKPRIINPADRPDLSAAGPGGRRGAALSSGAGANQGGPPPVPGAAPASGGPSLQPGSSYKHKSGATIEILPEGG